MNEHGKQSRHDEMFGVWFCVTSITTDQPSRQSMKFCSADSICQLASARHTAVDVTSAHSAPAKNALGAAGTTHSSNRKTVFSPVRCSRVPSSIVTEPRDYPARFAEDKLAPTSGPWLPGSVSISSELQVLAIALGGPAAGLRFPSHRAFPKYKTGFRRN